MMCLIAFLTETFIIRFCIVSFAVFENSYIFMLFPTACFV